MRILIWIRSPGRRLAVLAAAAASGLGAFLALQAADAAPAPKDVLSTYANIAQATFGDSLATAQKLAQAVDAFLALPNTATLGKAKAAWLAAREPYQQTEAYRFGNRIVDDWEGRVNAWPLDEGLIDYVSASNGYGAQSDQNELYVANVIAKRSLKIAGKTVDTSRITKTLIAKSLHEAGGVEANVATGYHAIEFLLWGQDNNGTGPGAGARPASDYNLSNCTNGNCDRRADYLRAAAELLVDDLTEMTAHWAPGGVAREGLLAGPSGAGLSAMLTGMGSLSYGELAGQRMKLGLLLHDPEEEHDCFSDNTHNSHYFSALGIRNVYLGSYMRVDGTSVSGPSPSDIVKAKAPGVDAALRAKLDATMAAMQAMVTRAEAGEAYDQMIGERNDAGNAVVQAAIDALIAQTKDIERAVATLGLTRLSFEGSDSLDDPSKVGGAVAKPGPK